jgi:hypothetical protein
VDDLDSAKKREVKEKKRQWLKLLHYLQIPSSGRSRGTAGHTPPALTTFQMKGGD